MTSKKAALYSCAALIALSLAGAAWAAPRNFDVPAQEAVKAIPEFGRQAGVQVVAPADQLKGVRTIAVRGAMEVNDALALLLRGTGLEVASNDGRVIVLRMAAAADETPAPKQAASAEGEPQGREAGAPVEKVTVTGSRIRGAKSASPVVTVTQEDMRRAGHNDLGEVVRALPQNFAGGQNPTVGLGAVTSANFTGSSSANLRGLGPDATLTLLNGARLPYDGNIQATDVIAIPTAAVERMEILLDGASAIYGSDAVGGVVNVVLKRDYDGAEVSARYGIATEGGFEQQQYNAVAGTTWTTGGFLMTADFMRNDEVRARDRSYLSGLPNQNVTIHPQSSQKSALFSGHQALGDIFEVTLDAFYTERDTWDLGQTSVIFDTTRDSVIWSIAPALSANLGGDWSLRVHGAIGSNENINGLKAYTTTGTPLAVVSPRTLFENRAEAAGVELEGPLFALSGGDARLATGGGYRRATFDQLQLVDGVHVSQGEARNHHAYGELNLPFVSAEQGIPLIARFEISGAVRYESHNSFGDVTTPKVGVIWGLVPGFDVRASWGESFKAPTLSQQYTAPTLTLYPGFFFGQPGTLIYAGGGNTGLEPERADVVTAGFVATPEFLPGFKLEFSWFDIEYTDRVLQPIANLGLLTSPAYAAFVTFNPTVAQQNAAFAALGFPVGSFTLNATGGAYNPADVSTIINNRYTNATSDHASGIDLIAQYRTEAFGGQLTLTGNGTWIDGTRMLTSTSPEAPSSGIVFYPAEFKGRLGATWSNEGFTVSTAVNHVGSVTNTNFVPNVELNSMTTLDLVFDYQMETGPLGNMGFTIAIINLFDEEPPYMLPSQPFYVPYDSTNYTALGRTINATVTKRF